MTPPNDINQDLGLGSRVAEGSGVRFLNRDGSFNVIRHGLPLARTLSPYHALLTMSWARYYLLVAGGYLAINLIFASAYLLCGPGALAGSHTARPTDRFVEAFFFSVQTLATIGYGVLSPRTLAAHCLVALEALVGLMGFALATGILFARFSRPNARILFSNHAVIAPYHGGAAFEFRLANARRNQLIEVEATVILTRWETGHRQRARRFHTLALERNRVTFLPLHWVVVHPITESSPLWGVTREELEGSDAEFLILLTAIDETFAQTVHARSSYKHHEVVWGARFRDLFLPSPGGVMRIDLRRLHDIDVTT